MGDELAPPPDAPQHARRQASRNRLIGGRDATTGTLVAADRTDDADGLTLDQI